MTSLLCFFLIFCPENWITSSTLHSAEKWGWVKTPGPIDLSPPGGLRWVSVDLWAFWHKYSIIWNHHLGPWVLFPCFQFVFHSLLFGPFHVFLLRIHGGFLDEIFEAMNSSQEVRQKVTKQVSTMGCLLNQQQAVRASDCLAEVWGEKDSQTSFQLFARLHEWCGTWRVLTCVTKLFLSGQQDVNSQPSDRRRPWMFSRKILPRPQKPWCTKYKLSLALLHR